MAYNVRCLQNPRKLSRQCTFISWHGDKRYGNLPFEGNVLTCLRSLEFRIFNEIQVSVFSWNLSQVSCHTSVLSRYLVYLMLSTLYILSM